MASRRHELLQRQQDLGARLHQRQAEVDVIQQLEIACRGGEVRHLVVHDQARPAGLRFDRRLQAELAAEQSGLIHRAANGDPARLAVNRHFDLVGGEVRNLAVQAVAEPAVGLELGRAIALQAAATEQFIKAVEPA